MTKRAPLLIFEVLKMTPAQLTCTAPERAVLVQLVDAMNPAANGMLVWPGQDKLADLTGLGERTVRRALKSLCDQDLIKLHQRTPRCTIYAINSGLIHSLYVTGQSGQSQPSDRPERPVRPATGAKVTGHSGRSIEQPIEHPREQPISTFGCSSNLEDRGDPVQRKLAICQVVAGAAEQLRSADQEQPNEKKPAEAREEALRLAAGMRAREGPG